MSRSLVAALALLAGGCTTMDLDDVWSKSGAGTVSRDDWACRREVDEGAPRTPGVLVGGVADGVRVYLDEKERERTYGKCMEARGSRAQPSK